jgi:hypothetical protein
MIDSFREVSKDTIQCFRKILGKSEEIGGRNPPPVVQIIAY